MCLYPRLIENRKYKANKKNGGVIPAINDPRTYYVPVGCQTCIECRKQKSREWMIRLSEDIKEHKNGVFVTLTFSPEAIAKIIEEDKEPEDRKRKHEWKDLKKLKGYDLDNAIATKAVRLFLERWRKKYKKSIRHWLVTELGHGKTEHLHLHGILWTEHVEDIRKIWGYGYVWDGYNVNTKRINYVNENTIAYITKYITKMDEKHLNYKPVILTSNGIGAAYSKTLAFQKNGYKPNGKTNETYRNEKGYKMGLPIYYRNKAYSEEERERLWIEKLDKGERYVCGEKIERGDEETYKNLVEYHRSRTAQLGYPSPSFIWSQKAYEEVRRKMKQLGKIGKYIVDQGTGEVEWEEN